MKIAIITANFGNFDKIIDPVEQSMTNDFYRFTDENFPRRHCSMSSRLQARIPKTFGWQMIPGYDYYIWVDSSCTLSHVDSVKWFIERCGDADLASFKHPNRNTIQEEADYMKKRLAMKCPYITPRYENELIDEQLAEIFADKEFVDNRLFATTALIYKNNDKVREMLKQLWYHTSRYHTNEQLSFPYVLYKTKCMVNTIPENYMKIPYLTYVRNKKI